MKPYLKTLLLLCVLLLPAFAYAQGFEDDEDVEDVEVPVDGGASFIAAAAVAYGAKKLKDMKTKKSDAA